MITLLAILMLSLAQLLFLIRIDINTHQGVHASIELPHCWLLMHSLHVIWRKPANSIYQRHDRIFFVFVQVRVHNNFTLEIGFE